MRMVATSRNFSEKLIERENTVANFHQYNIKNVDIILGDSMNMPLRPLFDGIICDPPYGIRAKVVQDLSE